MNSIFHKKFIAALGLSLFMLFLVTPFVVRADACDALKSSLNIEDGTNLSSGFPLICTAGGALLWGINLAIQFAGGIAILFIIVGGYQYVTSAGNAEQAENATKTLRNAVLGLIVIILAFAIVRVISNSISGSLTGNGNTISTGSNPTGNNNPTGSGSTPVTNGTPVDIAAVFGPMIEIPSTVPINGKLTVLFVANVSNSATDPVRAAFTQLIGSADPVTCSMTVTAGSKSTSANLIRQPSGWSATVQMDGPFDAVGQMQVGVSICSSQVLESVVNVTSATNVSPRGETIDLSKAISESNGVGIYDESEKAFKVYVFVPYQSYLDALCTNADNDLVGVWVDGENVAFKSKSIIKVGTSSLLYGETNVKKDQVPQSIGVEVCGRTLSASISKGQ